MRRIAVIATALFVLGAAGAAYAATSSSTYTGNIAFSNKKAGSVKKPSPVAFTLTLKVKPTPPYRAPIQLDVRTKIYGLALNGKNFPTCSYAKILVARNDNVCPKAARIATGYIDSTLGTPNNFQTPGVDCSPILNVWNSGQGKETYFFETNTTTRTCANGSLRTGQTPPYPGTYKIEGKYLVTDVPVPHYIDYPAGGVVGSLEYEQLRFTTQSKKVHGKTLVSQASVGCTKGKRPWSITTTTTAGAYGPGLKTTSVSGKAPC